MSSPPCSQTGSGTASPEFPELSLETLLQDFELFSIFAEYLHKTLAMENLTFWVAAENFRKRAPEDSEDRRRQAHEIYNKFLAENCQEEINVDSDVRDAIRSKLDDPDRQIFTQAQAAITQLLRESCFPRFARSPYYTRYKREYDLKQVLKAQHEDRRRGTPTLSPVPEAPVLPAETGSTSPPSSPTPGRAESYRKAMEIPTATESIGRKPSSDRKGLLSFFKADRSASTSNSPPTSKKQPEEGETLTSPRDDPMATFVRLFVNNNDGEKRSSSSRKLHTSSSSEGESTSSPSSRGALLQVLAEKAPPPLPPGSPLSNSPPSPKVSPHKPHEKLPSRVGLSTVIGPRASKVKTEQLSVSMNSLGGQVEQIRRELAEEQPSQQHQQQLHQPESFVSPSGSKSKRRSITTGSIDDHQSSTSPSRQTPPSKQGTPTPTTKPLAPVYNL